MYMCLLVGQYKDSSCTKLGHLQLSHAWFVTFCGVDAADMAASPFEQMRADPIWRPVIAAMPAHSWSAKYEDALEFRQYIADVHKSSKMLSKMTARKLQICFSPLGFSEVRHLVCFASAYHMLCGI